MGVCVEKAVVHNLLDKIIYKFAADLIKVIAACEKLFLMVDGNTINVFHNKDAGCGIFSVKNGRFYFSWKILPCWLLPSGNSSLPG